MCLILQYILFLLYMSSGFTSNYNDSGYTLTGTWYDASGNLVTGAITSKDIYTTTELTGVYIISGTYNGGSNSYYPVLSSFNNGINMNKGSADDALLIYPGYGFILYNNTNYTGTQSRNYVNTSTTPIVYYCGTSGGWVGYGTAILTTSGSAYPRNGINSAKIYFDGTEIFVNGIS